MAKTGGVNPFEIPDDTPTNDPRIVKLTQNLFMAGIKVRIGMPPGMLPTDLLPIVELGNSANNVTFRMYCAEFQVVQNVPGGGFPGQLGSWNVWSQSSGTPWYAETHVDLTVADLDKDLNTPYFQQRPDQRTQILNRLNNLSSTAFSLQQLLMDLDNAIMQTLPVMVGVPSGSPAAVIVERTFVDVYSTAAQQNGSPLLALTAVAQNVPDPSQIQMTSFERQVSQYKDATGAVIPNPTAAQAAVTTLDHLCMIDNHSTPGASSFTWNWVQPGNVNQQSGTIGINRQTFGQYLLDTIMPTIQNTCITSNVSVKAEDGLGDWSYSFTLTGQQTPQTSQVTAGGSGSEVISVAWTSQNEPGVKAKDSDLAFFIELDIMPDYTCTVSFSGSSITIVQRLWVWIFVQWDATSEGINGYDTTITDVYNMTVDQNGALQIIRDPTKHTSQDNSQQPDRSWLVNIFTGVNDAVSEVKSQITELVSFDLSAIEFTGPQNFVFPGAKVFTYSSATFSTNQDLICDITYVAPSQSSQPMSMMMAEVPVATERLERTVLLAAPGSGPKSSATSVTMSHASDMIQNYVQGEIVSPTGKFEAVQTDDGHAMLFAMDTSNVLEVILEQSGIGATGWQRVDLSSALLAANFSSDPKAVLRTFDVGQSAIDGTIGVAAAISSGGSDNLFLSLYNSNSNTSWTASPGWTSIPFDAANPSGTRQTISIVGILFAETTNNHQYIIVDVDRSPTATIKDIARYYVDPLKASGTFWTKHDAPVDIQDGNYQSCVGRTQNGIIDGIYTSGTAGASAQLVYLPVINIYGGGPALPSRLNLPAGVQASAIATSRIVDPSSNLYGSTDLYAVSGSILYRFAADNQKDGTIGTPLLNSTVFSGTSQLSTMTNNGVTTVWGKNSNDQVYYVSCPSSQLSVPGAWSAPVPILTGVELMSPYINRTDGGNTIFASGGNQLQRLTQATGTDAKIWTVDAITLVAAPVERSLSFNSYTTTIKVVDDQKMPAAAIDVSISTASRTPVYINGLYYVLSTTPVTVVTDATGTVTVIEPTQNTISGTVLSIICNGGTSPTTINPMNNAFQAMAALNTEDSLKGATIPTNIVAGGTQGPSSSSPLVAASTSSDDLSVVATGMSNLNTAYQSVNSTQSKSTSPATSAPESPTTPFMDLTRRSTSTSVTASAAIALPSVSMPVVPHTLFLASVPLSDIGTDIAIAAGDLFRWLQSGIDSVINIIKDAASDVWHFVATIAGTAYRAALDSIDAIVGAVEWVFNAIKTGVEDIIHFLEFLFDWDDIKLTKDVICNVTQQWMQSQVDGLTTAKASVDSGIASMGDKINQWAGINWPSSIGEVATQPASAGASNPTDGQTSGSQMLNTHYKNHGTDLTIVGDQPTPDLVQQAISDLLNALEQEGQVLSATITQLQNLATSFTSLTIEQVLQKLVAILADTVLSSVQVVVDTIFNLLIDLASTAITLMETKIHIPIISDILSDIGIPEISFLDLLCWIPAVAYTVVYKIANNKAPFSDSPDIQTLIAATSWEAVQAVLQQQSQTPPQAGATVMSLAVSDTSPSSDVYSTASDTQKALYVAGFEISGFMSLMSAFVGSFEASVETGSPNPWSIPSAIVSIIGGATGVMADMAIPRDELQDEVLKGFSIAINVATYSSKIAFSSIGQKMLKAYDPEGVLIAKDGRATGATIDMICVFQAVWVTVGHFAELGDIGAGADKSAAIVGEVANLTSYMSRVAYTVAVTDDDPETKAVAVGVIAVTNGLTGGLKMAQGLID